MSDELLTRREVATWLKVHINTIDNMRKRDPDFPQPIYVTARNKRYSRKAIYAYLYRRSLSTSDDNESRPAVAVAPHAHPE